MFGKNRDSMRIKSAYSPLSHVKSHDKNNQLLKNV